MGYDYVFFNFATTGFGNPIRPVQLGAVAAFNPRKKFNRYMEPGRPIQPGATDKHGLTTDNSCTKLIKKGHEIRCVGREAGIRAFMKWLQKFFDKRVILVAHRCFGYHAKVLLECLDLYGISHEKIAGFADSLNMSRRLCPDKHPHTLEAMLGKPRSYHALNMAYDCRFLVKSILVRLHSEESFKRTITNPKNYKTKAELITSKKSVENGLIEQFREMSFSYRVSY